MLLGRNKIGTCKRNEKLTGFEKKLSQKIVASELGP